VRTRLFVARVPGEPVPKGRPRVGVNGTFSPKRTKEAENKIAWSVKDILINRAHRFPDGESRFFVKLTFSSRKLIGNRNAPDLDNCIKLVGDALNGVVWEDDIQIAGIEATIERDLDYEPMTLIEVFIEEES